MTTVAGPSTFRHHRTARLKPELQVSAYERVASLLLALLILVGLVVFVLFMAWLGARYLFPPLKAVPAILQQVGGGFENGEIGESMQLDSPTPQEIAKESDLVEPEFQETVAAVLDVVATRQADISDPALTDQFERTEGGGQQIGTGTRPGRGSGGSGAPGIAPHERWEIRFEEGNTLDQYAQQLDFFGIELGILGATNQVIYAKNLSQPKPTTYSGPRDKEQRLYMSWRQGKLKESDRELMQKAGVPTAGKVLLQFYPEATEQLLLHAEHDYRNRNASEIRKTVFEIRPGGGGFEFHVISQSYL